MAQPLQVQPFRSALGLPIGTVIDDSFPQAGDALAGRYGTVLPQTGLQQSYRYGVGGPEQQPGQGTIPPAPVTTMPPSAEESQKTVKSEARELFELLMQQREYENSEEVMARKNKYALELMNAIGDKQMELGWKSNLIGFGLKELPRLMTEPARRRNRYLDDMVLNSPAIAQQSAGMFTGQGIPNYAMGI